MIKEAIDRILALAAPTYFEARGRTYSDRDMKAIKPPLPKTLLVNTLTGLVDFINLHKDTDLAYGDFFVQVESHNEVQVLSGLTPEWMDRKVFLIATPVQFDVFPFERFMGVEEFIIKLQARMIPDEQITDLLKMVSNIRDENLKTSSDDGVSQVVTVKAGVALVTEKKVPNPITLRPYRTFPDIEQPASPFIFRLRSERGEMTAAIYESDGGKWRLEAMQSVKNFLVENLSGVPVIA